MLKADIKELSLKEGRTLLTGINLELRNHCIHTILGLNGSGKTTLIKSLTGLLNKQHYSITGSVLFEGKDILKLNRDELLILRKNKIKYVFQDAVNCFNQLRTFGYYFEHLSSEREEINYLLDYFILPGYTELCNLHPYEVSGGMAQRISIILALSAHPEIIILDEPTSGIDSAISNLFLLKLKEFASWENHSVLLVTHDINFAQKISDEIAFLSAGKFSRFYSTNELFSELETPEIIQTNEKQKSTDNSELLRKYIDSYKQLLI
jgi:ABC-type glutathione transport system ATPase component